MSRVEINLENAAADIVLDGQRVTGLVSDIDIRVESLATTVSTLGFIDRATVTLALTLGELTMADDRAEVTIDADTEELLLKLGWRKP